MIRNQISVVEPIKIKYQRNTNLNNDDILIIDISLLWRAIMCVVIEMFIDFLGSGNKRALNYTYFKAWKERSLLHHR